MLNIYHVIHIYLFCPLFFFIPFCWCFLSSLLAFFFVTYIFLQVSHTAHYSPLLWYLWPVSFTHNCFSSVLTQLSVLEVDFAIISGIINVHIFPFHFICINFLFIVCSIYYNSYNLINSISSWKDNLFGFYKHSWKG